MSNSQTTPYSGRAPGWSLTVFWNRFWRDPRIRRGMGMALLITILAICSGKPLGLFLPLHTGFTASLLGLCALILYGLLIPLTASMVFYTCIRLFYRTDVDIFDLIPKQYLARIPILIPALAMFLPQDSRYLYYLENPLPHPMTLSLFMEILQTQPLHLIHPAGSEWYDILVLVLVKPAAITAGALWSSILMYRNFKETAHMPHTRRTLYIFLPALLLIGCITFSAMAWMDAMLLTHAMP